MTVHSTSESQVFPSIQLLLCLEQQPGPAATSLPLQLLVLLRSDGGSAIHTVSVEPTQTRRKLAVPHLQLMHLSQKLLISF